MMKAIAPAALSALAATALTLSACGGEVAAPKPLNIVNYAKVQDTSRLHRWAGNRLFVLPIAFAAGGVVSLKHPTLALPVLGATTLFVIVLCVFLAIGARRFESTR